MVRPKEFGILLLLLIVIVLPVSVEAQGLPSYHKYQGPIKPGIEITRENFTRYLPELKKLLPPAKLKWYGEGVNHGIVTMPIVATTYPPLGRGQLEATRKYSGTARVLANNQLVDWKAGVPFPEPKNVLEIIWNSNPTVSRGSANDDNAFFYWFGLFNGTKYEKYLKWHFYCRKYRARADMPPLGDLSLFTERNINDKTAILVTEPHEVKGFIQLRVKYWDIDKPDESYAYIPALRRIRRLTGSDVTDPMLGSDCVYDDFEVWRQKLNSKMTFKALEYRDFLVPRHYVGGMSSRPPYDYRKNGPCFQVEWEIRPQWVMEIMINDRDYVYSKRIVYADGVPLDQGGGYMLYWGEQYDQKGRLWKANGTGAPSDNGKGLKSFYDWIYLNYQTNHYTVMDGYPCFVLEEKKYNKIFPLNEDLVSIKGLMRKAR